MNKEIKEKISKPLFSRLLTISKNIWNNLWEYPKTTIFYLFIIYLGLFTKGSKFIFRFNYNAYYNFIPGIAVMLILILAFRLGGRKFFVNIANSVFLLYVGCILLSSLYWRNFLVYFMLTIYCFYHAIFILAILCFPEKKPKIPDTRINKLYFIIISTISLIALYYLVLYFRRLFQL